MLPKIRVDALGRGAIDLGHLLQGGTTAMQLMFTGCRASCPIQGAVFAEVQRQLVGAPQGLNLLSVSIDSLGDDTRAVRAWLERHGAMPSRWSGAVVSTQDRDALLAFCAAAARGPDPHTPQVYLFDARARLRFRTVHHPPPEEVVRIMKQLHAQS
jgi:protein SCO1/2